MDLEALRERMMSSFVKSNKARLSGGRETSLYDVTMGFFHAVDWREVGETFPVRAFG